MQIQAPGKRGREGVAGPCPAPSHLEYAAAQLQQPPVGQGALVPHAPTGSSQFYIPTYNAMPELHTTGNAFAPPTATSRAGVTGTAGDAPAWDPWAALAMRIGKEPLMVWGTCRLYGSQHPRVIGFQFWADTGSDCTIFPLVHWPGHWQFKEVPPVNGVGGQSRAWKSTQLVALTLHTKKGPGVSTSAAALMLEEAPSSREGTVSVIRINSHDPVKGYFQTGNDKVDAAAKGVWTLQEALKKAQIEEQRKAELEDARDPGRDVDEELQQGKQKLPQRATRMKPEEEEDVRELNALFLSAKSDMIWDKQVLEKQTILEELTEEEKHLNKMMEIE
ncbi:uncharacterized protein LOC134433841 [Melospiza melodia melodia]|uniref:uncharacterized protein LOC134433841 n=1 Tax=Melospiza melodia melodia TaxID=1914991 RepID=UPI002FD5BBE1